MPRADQIRLDSPALIFALLASLATSVIFGLLPALQLSEQDLNDALKDGGRQNAAGAARGARELLIVAEVAVSIVLLVGAGLLIRSLWHLQQVDPGFAADKVLAMEVSLPTARYKEGEQMPFYQRLEERVRALPGVAAAGAVNILPLSSNYDSRGVRSKIIRGQTDRDSRLKDARQRLDTSRRWASRCWRAATSMRTMSTAASSS